VPKTPGPEPQPDAKLVSIAEAAAAYIAEHEQVRSAPNTIKKYRELTRKVQIFSDDIGLRTIDEWNPALVRQFRGTWKVSPLTAQKQLGNLKAFFEFCLENEWITRNPARLGRRNNRATRGGDGDSMAKQRIPFSDAELALMYETCRELSRTEKREWPKKKDGRQVETTTPFRDYHRKWTGQDLADFIAVSVHTGLRISDVATFHISRLQDNGEVKVRCQKNGAWVCLWVPDWLWARIRARAKTVGPLIFGEHETEDVNVIADVWRRKLKKIWDLCGPWKVKPVHHRFRHTFIRLLLERRVPLSVISDLTGDTEQVIRKYYSAWVPGRQEQATEALKAAWAGKPTPRNSGKVRAIR
jgi:integrase